MTPSNANGKTHDNYAPLTRSQWTLPVISWLPSNRKQMQYNPTRQSTGVSVSIRANPNTLNLAHTDSLLMHLGNDVGKETIPRKSAGTTGSQITQNKWKIPPREPESERKMSWNEGGFLIEQKSHSWVFSPDWRGMVRSPFVVLNILPGLGKATICHLLDSNHFLYLNTEDISGLKVKKPERTKFKAIILLWLTSSSAKVRQFILPLPVLRPLLQAAHCNYHSSSRIGHSNSCNKLLLLIPVKYGTGTIYGN